MEKGKGTKTGESGDKICAAITLLESKTFDSYAHAPHQQADAYADPEYAWDDYMQS
jgi:hypothetical protein